MAAGPAWISPVKMGRLRHHLRMLGPIEANYYIVLLEVDDQGILMHDP